MGSKDAEKNVYPEAAPNVEQLPDKAVNTKENRDSLYVKQRKIHPKRVSGRYRRLKWICMACILSIYYLLPWMRWDRGSTAPSQAVLLDIPERKFYFFQIEIWPQEIYFLTGILILSALILFFITALLGRVWCGYLCPQTVWTDLFVFIERLIEGDRNKRMKLETAPWSLDKIVKRVIKHSIWIFIAAATGGAWVFYYADAPTLLMELIKGEASLVAYVFLGIFTAATYALGGISREQVCTYMCPWPRIQGALIDKETLLVSYNEKRGEPRGKYKQGSSWEDRGDCISCRQCVAVCPSGIDIRNGLQMECIQCALCVDACNNIMKKINRPKGLIGYYTPAQLEQKNDTKQPAYKLARPRTILYAVLIVLVSTIMLIGLTNRSVMDMNILRDRNPLYVKLSDGSIRNGYTFKIINKDHKKQTFTIKIHNLEGAVFTSTALNSDIKGNTATLTIGPDRLSENKLYVTLPKNYFSPEFVNKGSVDLIFTISRKSDNLTKQVDSSFKGPALHHR